MLPDGSGLELAQQIHAIDPRLPVTFITISEDSDIAIEAMKLGAYDFLLKPLDVAQVQDVIDRAGNPPYDASAGGTGLRRG